MIAIHELGHFLVARAFKVKINEFAIGMGPKLLKKQSKKSGTLYSLRAFPVGGFVSMEGESEASDEEGSFSKKPAWQKLLISLAGPAMNIFLGFILTFVLVITLRDPSGNILLSSNTVANFDKDAASSESWIISESNELTDTLMPGDTIIKVGNTRVHTATELAYEISMQCSKLIEVKKTVNGETSYVTDISCVSLTVIRNGETVVLKNVAFKADSTEGIVTGTPDFRVARENASFFNIIKHTLFRSLSSVKMIWDSFVGLITGRFGLESMSGPIGTTEAIATVASEGWYTLLYFVTIITMNLGVFNLFPVLPLDGGHNVFHIYELIVRKPVPKKITFALQAFGIVLMFGLIIIVSINDIIGLFN